MPGNSLIILGTISSLDLFFKKDSVSFKKGQGQLNCQKTGNNEGYVTIYVTQNKKCNSHERLRS